MNGSSVCHRLPDLVKLWLALGVVGIVLSIPVHNSAVRHANSVEDVLQSARNWPVHGVLACVIFIGHSVARIPLVYLLRRLLLFLPMVMMLSISLPAAEGFNTSAGWTLMFSILFRSSLAFMAMLWLINVLPFDRMLTTLRRLWIPEVLLSMLAFMHRYLFVLWEELGRMTTARQARTFGKASLWFRWQSSARMVGTLLIRAMTRAERVHQAMLARGWDGRMRSIDPAAFDRPSEGGVGEVDRGS
ncbi:MAG: energy-coupling factor transporter transmembrane component T [Planctomycetota bacterium]|nr:energy-coupling factor transporter transmembrane component T [Planctomycetota bacterium]